MKTNLILLAVSALTVATPAVIQSAQSDTPANTALPGDPAVLGEHPRGGLVTVVPNRPASHSQWRVAWKSLTALPAAERDRLRDLVRAVDKANRPRAPRTLTPAAAAVAIPACMREI